MTVNYTYNYKRVLLFLLAGCLALFVPLIRNFHFESAMLAALIGAFWAGIKLFNASSESTGHTDFADALHVLAYLYLAAFPLLIYSLITGCFTTDGLGFWLLLPGPSVFLGASVGRLLRRLSVPGSGWITFLILAGIAVGQLLIELYHLPQVYFYNHIWGVWPGPVYDESVTLSFSLLYFRGITAGWIMTIWVIPTLAASNSARWLGSVSLLFLLMSYSNLAEFGIISPQEYLQERLGGHHQTKSFDIYYDQTNYSPQEINRYALLHEFYLHEITKKLDISKDYTSDKISSYLYAHPWQKKQLVGAKYTSYVPVWLNDDQLHIAKQQLNSSLKHELAHVIAKQFGNRVINASWSIGMVEGLAVAVAGGRSTHSTIDQLVAADSTYPSSEQLKTGLSFWGFYGGRATVNYTTMGSFLRFLMDQYPVEAIKRAYRTGNVESAANTPIRQLTSDWHAHLQTVPTDSLDRSTAQQLFSIRSILEKPCPHTVSKTYELWDQAQYHLAERDTAIARRLINRAKNITPNNTLIWSMWAYYKLREGATEEILASDVADQNHPLVLIRQADALFLKGKNDIATMKLASVADSVNNHPNHPLFGALRARSDSTQWMRRLQMITQDSLFSAPIVKRLNRYNQLTLIQKAIELKIWGKLDTYAKIVLSEPLVRHELPAYFDMIEWLIVLDNGELAQKWLAKISGMDSKKSLRLKHQLQLEHLSSLADFSEDFVFSSTSTK